MLVRDFLLLQAAAECMGGLLPFHIQNAVWAERQRDLARLRTQIQMLMADSGQSPQLEVAKVPGRRPCFPSTVTCFLCGLQELLEPMKGLVRGQSATLSVRQRTPPMRLCRGPVTDPDDGSTLTWYQCEAEEEHQMHVRESACPPRWTVQEVVVWDVTMLIGDVEITSSSVSPQRPLFAPLASPESVRRFHEVAERLLSLNQ